MTNLKRFVSLVLIVTLLSKESGCQDASSYVTPENIVKSLGKLASLAGVPYVEKLTMMAAPLLAQKKSDLKSDLEKNVEASFQKLESKIENEISDSQYKWNLAHKLNKVMIRVKRIKESYTALLDLVINNRSIESNVAQSFIREYTKSHIHSIDLIQNLDYVYDNVFPVVTTDMLVDNDPSVLGLILASKKVNLL